MLTKLINNSRLRVWLYHKQHNIYGIHRKSLKKLGWIFFLGRLRISTTIIK